MKRVLDFAPRVLVLTALASTTAGCGASLSDYSLKDAEWFSRPKMFNRTVSVETPPLSAFGPVAPNDLMSADGACPGGGPSDANASSGSVALGHTECDVARAVGTPDNVNLTANERGDRIAVVTYSRGPRAGVYRFTAGRLSEIEGVAPPAEPAKRSKKRA